MFQKICNYLSILSTILALGILGGGFFTYKYVTSEQFKNKMLNMATQKIQGAIPDMLDAQLPTMTEKASPMPFPIPKK